MNKKPVRPFGFTIVELLVVIVVIGILATVTIVSFSGITRRAVEISVQSDLSNAAKQLKLVQAEFDQFPSTIDCAQADSATNKCLKTSSGNTIGDLQVSNKVGKQSFCLEITNGSVGYFVTNDTTPTAGNCPVFPRLATSGSHTCAIGSNNYAYCWGLGNASQIGDGTSGANRLIPTEVDRSTALNGLTVKAFTAGYSHSCVIASDDNAYCWGANTYGEVGDGTSGTYKLSPVAVTRSGSLNGLAIKSITAGYFHTCVLASDDNAYCWGRNNYGQVGNNTSGANVLSPTPVHRSGALSGLTIKSISSSNYNNCVVASDNNAYCWGENSYGQIGDNTSGASKVEPTAVNKTGALNGLIVKSVAVGGVNACAVASDSNAYCWGFNGDGELGTGVSGASQLTPIAVNRFGALSGLTIKSMSLGGLHVCAIASDNNAYCWGDNGFRQVGNGSFGTDIKSPTLVDKSGLLSSLTVKLIATGENHTCAIASDDGYYCWGRNDSGQLGNNSSGTNVLSPGAVLSLP